MELTNFSFMFVDIIKQLISMLEVTEDYVGPQVLAALTYVGRKGIFHNSSIHTVRRNYNTLKDLNN